MQSSQPKTIQDVHIKRVSVWFYIIAAFQLIYAISNWSAAGTYGAFAVGLGVADLLIGITFVALGFFAGQKHVWAFVIGLALYILRALVLGLTNPIFIVVRLFLAYRIWVGLQACIAANRADAAMSLLNQRRLVMPQSSPAASNAATSFASSTTPVEPDAPPPSAWRPTAWQPTPPTTGAADSPPTPWRPTPTPSPEPGSES